MATATSLPTNVAAGAIGHLGHTNTLHTAVNALTGSSMVSVLDYGAISSTTQSAGNDAANTAAFARAAATGKTVLVPPGNYFGSYNLDPGDAPRFVGTDPWDCYITVKAGCYFIDGNQRWTNIRLENLTVQQGAGAIRNRYTGSNVVDAHRIYDCRFTDYTVCAISDNSSDGPFWKIMRCCFRALTDTRTIGVALTGLTDKVNIQDCEWQCNQIHIKLGYGGNNAVIRDNDFVQYRAPTAGLHRAMVWVVPNVGINNSGNGFLLDACKFGNENLGPDDFRVLIADEASGSLFGSRLPNLATDSTGYVTGHRYRDCLINGSGNFTNPFIYSTANRFQGSYISGMFLAGNKPSYLIQYRTAGGLGTDFASNLTGPVLFRSKIALTLAATNRTGAAQPVNLSSSANQMQIV